jgi:hypothetical protein
VHVTARQTLSFFPYTTYNSESLRTVLPSLLSTTERNGFRFVNSSFLKGRIHEPEIAVTVAGFGPGIAARRRAGGASSSS